MLILLLLCLSFALSVATLADSIVVSYCAAGEGNSLCSAVKKMFVQSSCIVKFVKNKP